MGWSKDNFKELASRAMIDLARDLRQRETPAEDLLWEVLRDRKLANLKFRRQHPIPGTTYVVDFYCHQFQVVIEVDGGIHVIQMEADEERQAIIEEKSYRIIRFTNEQVLSDLVSVLHNIVNFTQPMPHRNI
jgi:very-short-patch-repair endonuclease